MKLFIPPLGTKLTLLKNFTFDLLCEERNQKLWNLKMQLPMSSIPWQHARDLWKPVTLWAGDELIVDRVYIRKGYRSYDSVTFRGWTRESGTDHKIRFWMKLEDANRLDVEVIE